MWHSQLKHCPPNLLKLSCLQTEHDLFIAVKESSLVQVKELLSQGVNVNARWFKVMMQHVVVYVLCYDAKVSNLLRALSFQKTCDTGATDVQHSCDTVHVDLPDTMQSSHGFVLEMLF